jgi:uncharacterized DUF497 family protein
MARVFVSHPSRDNDLAAREAIGRLGLQVVIVVVFAPLGTEAISVVSMRFAGKRVFDDR